MYSDPGPARLQVGIKNAVDDFRFKDDQRLEVPIVVTPATQVLDDDYGLELVPATGVSLQGNTVIFGSSKNGPLTAEVKLIELDEPFNSREGRDAEAADRSDSSLTVDIPRSESTSTPGASVLSSTGFGRAATGERVGNGSITLVDDDTSKFVSQVFADRNQTGIRASRPPGLLNFQESSFERVDSLKILSTLSHWILVLYKLFQIQIFP